VYCVYVVVVVDVDVDVESWKQQAQSSECACTSYVGRSACLQILFRSEILCSEILRRLTSYENCEHEHEKEETVVRK